MSKIEEALEKAKQARSGVKENKAVPETPVETTPKYTHTIFQGVNPDMMEENRIVTLAGKSSHITEQYRMLRTQILQRTEGNGDNCLMVTSAIDGEGKTTTAINLAVAIAQEVQKNVLLVDADLRRPSIHKVLGLKPEKGLVHYLIDHVPLENLLIRTGVEKLTFLPAGGTLSNSTEIFNSSRMKNFIREVKERYKDRYVIFDTTPLLSTADPVVLSQSMDGIIFVIQADRTQRSDLAEALGLLEGRNILGIVMNSLLETGRIYDYET
jgi:exopolysaccharide/PEP-CTERM locus tyrosine autokinase